MTEIKVQFKYYKYLEDFLSKNESIEDMVVPSSLKIDNPHLNELLIELNKTLFESGRK